MTSAIPQRRRPQPKEQRPPQEQRLPRGGRGVVREEEASEAESSWRGGADMTSSLFTGGATGAAKTQTPTVLLNASASAAAMESPSSPSNNSSSNRPFVTAAGFGATLLLPPLSPKKALAAVRGRRSSVENTNTNTAASMKKMEWLQNVQFATTSGNWQPLRQQLAATVAATLQCHTSAAVVEVDEKGHKKKKKRGSSFWRRLSGGGGGGSNSKVARETSASLLRQDLLGQTPLHAALSATQHKRAPTDVVLVLLQLEPRAAQVANHRGQLPLHTAVMNQHELEIIAEIVEAYPDALSKAAAVVTSSIPATATAAAAAVHGARLAATSAAATASSIIMLMTPLSLAMEQAKAATNLTEAPRTFWMTVMNHPLEHDEVTAAADAAAAATWQENQVDLWATVHWLLLAAATHPQTSLSVGAFSGNGGGSKSGDSRPMLVDALVYAAPPAVVALLIGASVTLLSNHENKATAFAGTSLYTCIARHYPLSILTSLACKCPPDVRSVRDETGMGLVAALFISGCFEKSVPLTEEWTLSQDFVAIMLESIEQGELMHHDNVAFLDWWNKIEFLIVFGSGQQQPQQHQQQCIMHNNGNNSNMSIPKHYLLHAALSNPDVPPLVIRLLMALYPDSLTMPAPKWMSLGLLASSNGTMPTATTDSPTTTMVAVGGGGGGSSLLPIHLCCKTFDYIPRNYEMQIMNKHETSLEWVVQVSPAQSIMSRYNGRSAFHYAIESGKLFHSLQALLQVDKRFLRWRDPVTGLFPCQLAATYSYKKNAFDSHKWSCVARNKYTHSVWRGLSGRQKAASVYRVAESEDVERLCTIFQLIRQDPIVLIATRSSSSPSSSSIIGGGGGSGGGASVVSAADDQSCAASVTRDSTGIGKVAAHYISWCYKQERKKGTAHIANVENMFVLREAMRLAPSAAGGDFCSSMPTDFETWFNKLKFWIHCCCPKTIPTGRQRPCNSGNSDMMNDDVAVPQEEAEEQQQQRLDIPQDQSDRFLLHMAVLNPDTPPAIVALVLAISRMSASVELPGTADLPLHIACRVPPYSPRIFESSNYSTLQLLAKAYPLATRVMSGGKLPLHIAIDSGKTWNDFKVVVEQEKRALLVRDHETGLYPFQLIAAKRPCSQEQWVRFMYMARNRTESSVWKGMQAVNRIQAIRAIRQEHELDILSSIFELLRRDASMIEPSSSSSSSSNDATIEESALDTYNDAKRKKKVIDEEEQGQQEEASESNVDETSCSSDHSDDNSDDDSESDMSSCLSSQMDERSRTTEQMHPSAIGDVVSPDAEGSGSDDADGAYSAEGGSERENKAQSALMRLLSQHTRDDEHQDKDDPFRCDASILSGVDVMSTLSSTLHSLHSTMHSTRHFPDGHRGSDFMPSIHSTVSEVDGESTLNASAATGLVNDSNGSGSFAEASVASTSSSYPTDFQSLACSLMPDSPESSESSESSSLVFFRMKRRRPKQHDDGEYVQTVRLSKSVPADNPSVSSASVVSPKGKRQSVSRPSLSESPRTVSQSTLKSAGTFAEDSYDLTLEDLTDVMDNASYKNGKSTDSRSKNLLASLASSGEFDILTTTGGNDESIGDLTEPHGSAGELMSDRTPMTPSSQSDISTKPDSSLTQPSLHPRFDTRPPGEAVNMVWITKERSDSDSDDYPDYGKTSIPDVQKVLNLSPELALAKDLKASMFSGGDSSSGSTSNASGSGDAETEQHATESESAAQTLLASTAIESLKSMNEEADTDSIHLDSDTKYGTDDYYKLAKASCNGTIGPIHTSNGDSEQKIASPYKECTMDANGTTNDGDEKLAHQKEPSKHSEECELAKKASTISDGTQESAVLEPVEVIFFDRATMRWVKRKVENKDESKSETANIQSAGKLESKSMTTPSPPEHPCYEAPKSGLPPPATEAAQPNGLRRHTSTSPMTTSNTPSPPKKEMLFDKKSMRWVARDEAKPEDSSKPNSKNEFSAQTTLSNGIKEASSPYTPVKPNMDTALIGSPFIELVSRHDIKQRNERLAKATHFAATKPIMRHSLLCRTPLGSIPESQSRVRSPPFLMPNHGHLSCIICQKNKREVLMIPCRHLSICRQCSNEFQSLRDCPLCQERISDRMFLF
jgi:Zinc finger, C3HC4 type (RING finger)